MFIPIAAARLVIAGVLILLSSAAGAQQPTAADFYAAYTRALATVRPAIFAAPKTPEQAHLVATLPQMESELEAMVRRLVGPLTTPKGFTGNGHWNGDWELIGFEKGVSGIGFSLGEPIYDYPYLLVSTMELLRHWPSLPPHLRRDPEAVFRDGLLSANEVMFKGIWSMPIGLLPVDAPPGADVAIASVGMENNDIGGVWPPRGISVYVRRGERIYIAALPPAVKFPQSVACGVDLQTAFDVKDPVALRALAKQCWEGGAKADSSIAAATRQAQKFIDDLAER